MDMSQQPLPPTSDESLMASISHFFGLLVALIVWATQKDKSRYVRFQATQAMAFDLVVSVMVFLTVGCLMVLIFGAMALGMGRMALTINQSEPSSGLISVFITLLTAIPILLPCIIIPIVGIIVVARLIATIQTFQGKDFRYPWLGKLVERTLEH
jgi:uncharacterized Tic20 family protein